jgi:hypothetical protein
MNMKERRAPFTAAVRIALVAMLLAAEPVSKGRGVQWIGRRRRVAQRSARRGRPASSPCCSVRPDGLVLLTPG